MLLIITVVLKWQTFLVINNKGLYV